MGVEIFYKDKFAKNEKFQNLLVSDHLISYPTNLLFKLKWTGCTPGKLLLNDQLLEVFPVTLETAGEYLFTVSDYTAFSTLLVYYSENGENLKERFVFSSKEELFVSDSFKSGSLTSHLEFWKKIARQARSKGETDVLFSKLIRESSLEILEENGVENPLFKERELIVSLIEQISKKPKLKLIGEDRLVRVGELDRVTSQTIHYFMKEPSTWDYRPMQVPRPNRVLKEEIEESIDLYENRFVLTFIDLLISVIKSELDTLNQLDANLKNKMMNLQTQIEFNILASRAHGELGELLAYQDLVQERVGLFKSYLSKIRDLRQPFSSLRAIKGPVRPNQVLILDKAYSKLYQLFMEYFRYHEKEEEEEKAPIDFLTYYIDSLFLLYLQRIEGFGFINENGASRIPLAVVPDSEYPFSKGEITFHFHLDVEEEIYQIKITRKDVVPGERSHRIEVILENPKGETGRITFLPGLFQWSSSAPLKEDIMELYEKSAQIASSYQSDSFVSCYWVYPAWDYEFSSSIPYETGHYLINVGSNFLESEDWNHFGGFKAGMLPQILEDDFSGDAFMRILHIQLFQLGLRQRCFICQSVGQKLQHSNAEEAYRCSNPECKMEWGLTTCSHCGGPLLKMQKKSKSSLLTETPKEELDQISDIDWLKNAERRNARFSLSSICENHYRDNSFFAICPSCGQCQHEKRKHRYCRRCDKKEQVNCSD